ncbi:hypothetical protein D9M71_363380 [compost metagenome]
MENGWLPSMVTALSVAMRVWPMMWLPFMFASLKRSAISAGRPMPLRISMLCPALMMRTCGASSASAARTAPSSAATLSTAALAFWNQSSEQPRRPSSAPIRAFQS